MAANTESIEKIDTLACTENRIQILTRVAEERSMTSRELREELDADRTTVKRNLDELVAHGWLENTNPAYTITPCGELVVAEFNHLLERMQRIARLEPFMRWVDVDDFDFDLYELVDAEVTVASSGDPYAPVNEHVEALKTADDVRTLLPSVGHEALEVTVERIEEADPSYDLIVEPACAETLQEASQYEALFEEVIASGAVDVSLYEGTIPYYLGILDDTVQIGVEDDEGIPRAMIETDSNAIRTWAERTYAEYKAETTPLGADPSDQ